jgi:hypothetical protein
MSVVHMVSVESFRQSNESTRLFYTVVLIPFFLGFLHHIDHVVRGNHVGWPLNPAVTPFTFSLAVYPLALFGFCLMYVTDRTIITYWLGFFGFTSVLVTYTHTFIEPPRDIINPHASPLVGYLALVLAIALSASLIWGLIYSLNRWRTNRMEY